MASQPPKSLARPTRHCVICPRQKIRLARLLASGICTNHFLLLGMNNQWNKGCLRLCPREHELKQLGVDALHSFIAYLSIYLARYFCPDNGGLPQNLITFYSKNCWLPNEKAFLIGAHFSKLHFHNSICFDNTTFPLGVLQYSCLVFLGGSHSDHFEGI